MDGQEAKCRSASRAPYFLAALVVGVVVLGVALAPSLAMRKLARQLRDPSKRFAASQQLLDKGSESVPWLIEVVEDPTHSGREEAMGVLGRLGDPRGVPALLAVDDPALADVRLRALGQIHSPESLAEVLRALDGDDVKLELAALFALTEWPQADDDRVVPRLIEYLDHYIPGAQANAIRGLGARRHAASEPRILEMLAADQPEVVREAAAWALLQLGSAEGVAAVDRAFEAGWVTLEE